ncbi:hypothetical protein AAHA92_17083 [Salvia divinorum]|uniref:Uncharacterized protein n=1 Tax=Salvia divinorum TaxID=28513 RepID=A0ABD1GXL8_SALDI
MLKVDGWSLVGKGEAFSIQGYGVWLLRVKNLVTVANLPITIVPFAQENGSKSGTNRGKMELFRGLYSVLRHWVLLFHHLPEASHSV